LRGPAREEGGPWFGYRRGREGEGGKERDLAKVAERRGRESDLVKVEEREGGRETWLR
jgi:hypothetical protein